MDNGLRLQAEAGRLARRALLGLRESKDHKGRRASLERAELVA